VAIRFDRLVRCEVLAKIAKGAVRMQELRRHFSFTVGLGGDGGIK